MRVRSCDAHKPCARRCLATDRCGGPSGVSYHAPCPVSRVIDIELRTSAASLGPGALGTEGPQAPPASFMVGARLVVIMIMR